jgi:hypothetical protein
MSFYYLASPYSKFPHGVHKAHQLACEATALLVQNGIPVFSPIAHTHDVAIYGKLDPCAHTLWMPADRPFMLAAKGIIVLRLEGWEDSYGVQLELDHFVFNHKPIHWMDPGVVPEGL